MSALEVTPFWKITLYKSTYTLLTYSANHNFNTWSTMPSNRMQHTQCQSSSSSIMAPY